MWASPAAENLLRRAMEHSPYYEIRGLACYRLAELLAERAEMARVRELVESPPRSESRAHRGGPEALELLKKSDPARLEDEAARLFERVIAEFPRVAENHRGHYSVGTVLEVPAKYELDRLRRLAVGKPAPVIVGVDLDGRPMKLSDYRGQVVLLYFSPYFPFFGDRESTNVVESFRKLRSPFDGKPLAILGVVTFEIDSYREALKVGGQPMRIWADQPTRDKIAGTIHAAWGVTREDPAGDRYLLDARGTIRYHLPGDPALTEKAIRVLLAEQGPAGPAPGVKAR